MFGERGGRGAQSVANPEMMNGSGQRSAAIRLPMPRATLVRVLSLLGHAGWDRGMSPRQDHCSLLKRLGGGRLQLRAAAPAGLRVCGRGRVERSPAPAGFHARGLAIETSFRRAFESGMSNMRGGQLGSRKRSDSAPNGPATSDFSLRVDSLLESCRSMTVIRPIIIGTEQCCEDEALVGAFLCPCGRHMPLQVTGKPTGPTTCIR